MVVPLLYEKVGSCTNTGTFVVKSKSSQYSDKGVLTTFCQVVIRLLETYTADIIIAETFSEIARYVKASTITPLELRMSFDSRL